MNAAVTRDLRTLQRYSVIECWARPGILIQDIASERVDHAHGPNVAIHGSLVVGGERWTIVTSDPLTALGLLILAREAWKDPKLYIMASNDPGDAPWRVVPGRGYLPPSFTRSFPSEVAACCALLRARVEALDKLV